MRVKTTFALSSLKKWGNSQAIRIPKEILRAVEFKENDKVKISIIKNSIMIQKVNSNEKNLQKRLENFYGKPIDDIYVDSTQEIDIGTPVGDEF